MRYDRVLLAAAFALIVAEADVHAYTDPGTGTMILQVLMAAFLGAMFYIRRIVSWLRGPKRGDLPPAEDNSEQRDIK